jgi:riboflavin biosynthesis pyrimidine reductase
MSGPNWKSTVPLPESVRLVWHESAPFPRDMPLDAFYADLAFPAATNGLPYLVANMVMTQNGEATVDGKAYPVGTRVDGLALTRLRVATDAVLTGIGTVVAEDVTAVLSDAEAARRVAAGRTPRILVAVVASALAFSPEILTRRLFTDSRFDRILVTSERASEGDVRRIEQRGLVVVRVKPTADGRVDLGEALRALARRGVGSVVTEGGPTLLTGLLRGRLVREYFLTTEPYVMGGAAAPRPVSGALDAPVMLSRISRIEHAFLEPQRRAPLVEAFDRFRVVYPEAAPPAGANG